MQVTIPACPNRSSTSPSRSRRVKTRHRKPGKGSSGDLAGLKANQSSPNRDTTAQANSSTTNTSKQLLEPSAALRGLSHEQQQRQLSSSSPDLICTTLEAEGQGKGESSVGGLERGGSLLLGKHSLSMILSEYSAFSLLTEYFEPKISRLQTFELRH